MCYCNVRTIQIKSKICKQNLQNFAKKALFIILDPQRFGESHAPDFYIFRGDIVVPTQCKGFAENISILIRVFDLPLTCA